MNRVFTKAADLFGLEPKKAARVPDEERLIFAQAYHELVQQLGRQQNPEIQKVFEAIEHVILSATDHSQIDIAFKSRRIMADVLDQRSEGPDMYVVPDETDRLRLELARDMLTTLVFNKISTLRDKTPSLGAGEPQARVFEKA